MNVAAVNVGITAVVGTNRATVIVRNNGWMQQALAAKGACGRVGLPHRVITYTVAAATRTERTLRGVGDNPFHLLA